MIEKNILEKFDKYTSNYNLNDPKIKLKYDHSIRVMKLSKKYATKLGYSKEDVELATLIGLLHDIGRFEQIKVYNTFDDSKSIDHALYGVKVLFEDNLIEEFWNKKEDYEIIKTAIYNHNKYKIENIKDERILMHTKLIRDTDKVEIIYMYGYLKEYTLKNKDYTISENIIKAVKNHMQVHNEDIKKECDGAVVGLCFAFDINNDVCLKEMKKNLKEYYKIIEKDNKFKSIYEEVIKYIDERINNYAR